VGATRLCLCRLLCAEAYNHTLQTRHTVPKGWTGFGRRHPCRSCCALLSFVTSLLFTSSRQCDQPIFKEVHFSEIYTKTLAT
jgi:hypothetical protein